MSGFVKPSNASLLPRLRSLRTSMRRAKLDAMLLVHPADLAHVSGFSGHDAMLLVTDRKVFLFTDSRYEEQARLETRGCDVIVRRKTMASEIATRLLVEMGPDHGGYRVGFDAGHMTVDVLGNVSKRTDELTRKKKLNDVEWVPQPDPLGAVREVKDGGEVKAIRHAIEVAESAFLAVASHVRAGVTEARLAGELILEMRSLGAADASFEPIVAAGANSSMPHYRPRMVKVEWNAPLLFDWGALVNGYCSDITRTLLLGEVSRKMKQVYDIVLAANCRAIEKIKAGMTGAEADKLARDVISKSGLGKRFGHSLGHGLGRDVHERPRLSQTATDAKTDVLRPGMVVTIEPGIYIPGVGGVRIEDDVVITKNGCEVLTTLPKDRKFVETLAG